MTGGGPEEGASSPPDAATLAGHLVAVGRTRDRVAFAALFIHFAPRLKTYHLRLGATEAGAEELAQEAMLMVWRKAALFDPGRAAASTWIFAVARNLRADALRRERLRAAPVGDAGGELPPRTAEAAAEVPDAAPGAEEMLDAAGRATRLRAALRALPEEQARVLELSYFGDRSHAEIGRDLGVPLGTVKGRLRLALARLRAALEGEEP